MINIKICYRENGSVSSVVSQGHTKDDINYAVIVLMKACGYKLMELKSAKMEKEDADLIFIYDIRQSKSAVAVVDTLVQGLNSLERKHSGCVAIMRLK